MNALVEGSLVRRKAEPDRGEYVLLALTTIAGERWAQIAGTRCDVCGAPLAPLYPALDPPEAGVEFVVEFRSRHPDGGPYDHEAERFVSGWILAEGLERVHPEP